MTAEEYLQQAYRLNELITSDLEELERLRTLSNSISSPNMSDMPSSGSRNTDATFVKSITKIIDLEKKVSSEIDRYVDLKNEIRYRISKIEKVNERLVLHCRYSNFNTWEQIAEKMNFTVQWVRKLHKKALHSFSKMYYL